MQIGVSAGPECKAVLQEITQLVEQKLASSGSKVKAIFDADDVWFVPLLHFPCKSILLICHRTFCSLGLPVCLSCCALIISLCFAAWNRWRLFLLFGWCCCYSSKYYDYVGFIINCIFVYLNFINSLLFFLDLWILQFQYGNPDKVCEPLVKAKKDGEDLVVCFSS